MVGNRFNVTSNYLVVVVKCYVKTLSDIYGNALNDQQNEHIGLGIVLLELWRLFSI